MKDILPLLKKTLERGANAVLMTLVRTEGACPRKPGVHRLLTEGGETAGTIGGGIAEFEAEKEAVSLLENRKGALREYAVNPGGEGGRITVLFRFMAAGDPASEAFCRNSCVFSEGGENGWFVVRVRPDFSWETGVYTAEKGLSGLSKNPALRPLFQNRAVWEETTDGGSFYVEPFGPAGTVFLYGGGHVAQALAPLLERLGFPYVLIESRRDFASPRLFPGAAQIILGEYAAAAASMPVTENDYILIMTRGHQADYELQWRALKTPACYIGAIGSAEKYEALCLRLAADGFSEHEIRRIRTPVGLSIEAETPAEIAVSIAAEMIQIRARRRNGKKG
jgi:xanthine dehydrogenase accessory factor